MLCGCHTYIYGVRGIVLQFKKAYFNDRKQYVNLKAEKSDVVEQDIGVIQGCKTGHMFFDIYCNDFHHLLGNDNYILYADDTAFV